MATIATRKRKSTVDEGASTSNRISKSRKATTRKTRTDGDKLVALVQAKNKPEHISEDPVSNETSINAAAKRTSSKRQREPEEVQTPQNKRFRNALPPTPSETPTRGASRLFDRLNLASTTISHTSSKDALAYTSPPLTPQSKGKPSIPIAVEDTIRLFGAFHSAWSLFVAHNGSGTPMHMLEVVARVTGSWKKRRIDLVDIRRLLGVLGDTSPFVIIDNGDGDLCLDIKDEAALTTILQTKKLIKDFEQRIRRQWDSWCAAGEDSDAKGEAFLKGLPLAKVCTSEVAADRSRQSKGALRLSLLKEKSASAADEASSRKIKTVTEESKTSAAVESRGSSLIDRILAKQQLASSKPRGPTREELERRSALDRIEEIALVLGLLAGSRPRVSFSMQTLVQHLQNSMRNPIARDEAERSVEFMAKEVCPRFVSLIRTGSLHGVVITRLGRPSTGDLKEKLDQAQLRTGL
ncbi:hypothetical protein K461DRAFT_276165 [Myriangium duriaei CBS 260.36]|uniref:DNA replication factor Cdt1 C-terminal domain-containing protein n=1 Tax=Myriangium duriaei CBS 260.36 TaxID=1168546 RepID=A0A9P4J3Y9_9PEZI|nr:hypothetical protein K461DRAFT_276165 [Myriangium duriaei CBS 260.36]